MGFLRKRTAGGSTQAGQGCNPASAIWGTLVPQIGRLPHSRDGPLYSAEAYVIPALSV